MNGVVLVDKPVGITSHDVVSVVRRAARTRRVGHAGTLDPFATGLLVLAVGQSTRLLPYIDGEPKVYDATITFGSETNTDDSTGEVTANAALPDLDKLSAALTQLTGTIKQVPPAYSAKLVDGKRAYAVARRGGQPALAPVDVTVHRWDVQLERAGSLDVRITCGGGTYIRALARDLGRALGSAAHCSQLRRVASGPAHVQDAVALQQLVPGAIADGGVALMNPLRVLQPMVHEVLDADALVHLAHGRTVRATAPGQRAALILDSQVVGIADRAAGDRWQPRVVLLETAAEATS